METNIFGNPFKATIRRPGEGRGLVTLAIFKSLDPGFRRDDVSQKMTLWQVLRSSAQRDGAGERHG